MHTTDTCETSSVTEIDKPTHRTDEGHENAMSTSSTAKQCQRNKPLSIDKQILVPPEMHNRVPPEMHSVNTYIPVRKCL